MQNQIKTLVLGSKGKVGSLVVEELVKLGHTVVGITRQLEDPSTHSNVSYINPDTASPAELDNALQGVTYLFLSAVPLDNNLHIHLKPWVDAAQRAQLSQIILLSAIVAEHDPEHPLRKLEQQLESGKVPYTFLRPNFFIENFYPGFAYETIKATGSIIVPAEDAKTSFISVTDVATFTAKIIGNEEAYGKAFTLTGSEAITHSEVAELINKSSGASISYISPEVGGWLAELEKAGLTAMQRTYLDELYVAVRKGTVEEVTPHIEQWIGRAPNTIGEYIDTHAKAWS